MVALQVWCCVGLECCGGVLLVVWLLVFIWCVACSMVCRARVQQWLSYCIVPWDVNVIVSWEVWCEKLVCGSTLQVLRGGVQA